jgi:uncharacterized membrane protein
MPFCCQCGNSAGPADVYCAKCGARQNVAAPPPPAGAAESINARTASMLCYIPFLGWIASIVVLASDKFRTNRTARFHAFQGLYLFVAWLIVDHVLAPLLSLGATSHMHAGGLLKAGMLGVWIFMLIKASQEQLFSLPIIGELAERSVAEQK